MSIGKIKEIIFHYFRHFGVFQAVCFFIKYIEISFRIHSSESSNIHIFAKLKIKTWTLIKTTSALYVTPCNEFFSTM